MAPLVKILKLFGDASDREYYRLIFSDGSTRILMKIPPGFSSVAEEITPCEKKNEELPFINIQRYLLSLDLPVPAIFSSSKKDGFLLLEDLGDKTLFEALEVATEKIFLFFYQKAILLLTLLQKKTKKIPALDCVAFSRRFDEKMLNLEFNHFLEYGIEDRFQIKVPVPEKKIFEEITRDISKKILLMPQGFVHRDFQSKNLMIHGDDLWLIDFQDALLGPQVYDLVALLRDSYVDFSPEQLSALMKDYVKKLDYQSTYHGRKEDLRRDFDLVTLQRKLKDTGRFQYIHTVKKNPKFLRYVPRSLGYVKEALERQPEYSELTALLESYLPEFNL